MPTNEDELLKLKSQIIQALGVFDLPTAEEDFKYGTSKYNKDEFWRLCEQAIQAHINRQVREVCEGVIGADDVQEWDEEESYCRKCDLQTIDDTRLCICQYRNILRKSQRQRLNQLAALKERGSV